MGMPKGCKVYRWTEREKEYLKDICFGRSYKEIAMLMTNKFNYEFKASQIKSALQRYNLTTGRTGRFEKGNIPWSKGTKGIKRASNGSFEKGHIPKNKKPVGSERVDSKDGFTRVKTREPNKWELKHKFIYEKHHGKVEKGSVVIFLDGNKKNFDINNLKCITKRQLLTLNVNNLITEDIELTKMGIEVANLIIKTSEAKKKIK